MNTLLISLDGGIWEVNSVHFWNMIDYIEDHAMYDGVEGFVFALRQIGLEDGFIDVILDAYGYEREETK